MRTSLLLLFAAALLTAPLANAADGRLRILFVGDVVLDGGPGHVITNGGDLCDQACTSLFDQTKHAWAKTAEWAKRDGEWQRRAGFALMAGLAWHDKHTVDARFLRLLPCTNLQVRCATTSARSSATARASSWACSPTASPAARVPTSPSQGRWPAARPAGALKPACGPPAT